MTLSRFGRPFFLLLTLLLMGSSLQTTAATRSSAPPSSVQPRAANPAFQAALDKLLKTAGQVGVQVFALTSGQVVWEHRQRDPLIPASLVKILTSYAALKQLGPYYRFSTSLWSSEGPTGPQGDTLAGNLWIKSDGDIFLTDEKAWSLACKLRESGLRRIQGGIFVDNSAFEPRSEKICLDGKCDRGYNPVLSATSLDFNTVTFHLSPGPKVASPVQVGRTPPGDYIQLSNQAVTGPKGSRVRLKIQSMGLTPEGREKFQVTGKLPLGATKDYEYRFNVEDPGSFVSHSFKALLQQAGIEVRGPAGKVGTIPQNARKLATGESLPLADLLYGLNRYSNNFMAEMLLRSLGAAASGAPGTADKGINAVQRTLRELGSTEQEVSLKSGSGLSRECRVSPQTFCRVLTSAYKDFSLGPEFLASFAMNAQEGTLKRRMRQSDITVRGKTGTLNNVVGFAGYVSHSQKGVYAAVIILNEVQNLWDAREAVDSLLEQIPGMASP